MRHAQISTGVETLRLTLEETLDVFGLARERQAAQLNESVLLHEILTLQALLKVLRLRVEDWKGSFVTFWKFWEFKLLTLDIAMSKGVPVVGESFLNIICRCEFDVSFAVGSPIAMANCQVNSLFAVQNLAGVQELDDVGGRGVPGQSTELNDVTSIVLADGVVLAAVILSHRVLVLVLGFNIIHVIHDSGKREDA